MGDPADFENFMGGYRRKRLEDPLGRDRRGEAAGAAIVTGGSTDDSEGYFVQADRDRGPTTRASASCVTSSSARS